MSRHTDVKDAVRKQRDYNKSSSRRLCSPQMQKYTFCISFVLNILFVKICSVSSIKAHAMGERSGYGNERFFDVKTNGVCVHIGLKA
eukprot:5562508-Pleurochrysis_carterae.AAC.1